jgi:septal ring factor EnvC (AmiA/AmiB activator)
MAKVLVLAALFISVPVVQAADQEGSTVIAANPVRKVVTLLQNMQKKVQAEGEKEKDLYDKFMCYCKNSGGGLSSSIAASEDKVPALGSSIKEAEEKKKQLDADLKGHQMDRSAAKDAMAQATAIREKEAAAFAKEKGELSADIAAISKAVTAISSGMSGSFLQTQTAQVLKRLVLNRESLLEADRQDIMAFLSGGQGEQYVPASGQIVGILNTIKDEMSKSLSDAEAAEAAAVASYEELMAAKEKEVNANTKAIEAKTLRVGETAVAIVQMKNDLTDTEEQLIEDQKFLADLDKTCKTQTKEWEERQRTRAEETQAIAETIKILNDDDALELFKKTLPGASSSFMQVAIEKSSMRKKALQIIRQIRRRDVQARPRLDFITLAIEGKAAGFEKVIKMIDDMVATLKKEQLDDDHKKEYCAKQFDFAEDKKKGLVKSVSDLEASIEEAKEGISTLASEIEALEDGIKALDKSVSEATEQRKEEHEDYTELMASDGAAKELLKFAMNRLNKFYNPKLYKPPPKRELSEEEQITLNMGGTLAPTAAPGGIAGSGVTALAELVAKRHLAAPEAPPEALGAYKKKTEESGGVIAMVNLLIKDLDKEMTEAETTEKDSQADYEAMLSDSAEKRATDTKALTEKTSAKAGLETDLESATESKASTVKELMGTEKYIASLHSECDWLLQYFDTRKAARASEMESLTTAKAVLSGADFSLLEQSHQKRSFNLRKRM